jgi:hypothetical protein
MAVVGTTADALSALAWEVDQGHIRDQENQILQAA